MKYIFFKHILVVSFLASLWSCGSSQSDTTYKESESSYVDNNTAPSTESPEGISQTTKDLTETIRNAEIRFKVKNTNAVLRNIEQLTDQYGGFIERSEQNAYTENYKTIQTGEDSLIEIRAYYLNSYMIVRVPNLKLDTFMRDIERLAFFVEQRRITAENVGLQLLSYKMKNEIAEKQQERLKKIADKKNEAEAELYRGNAAINAVDNSIAQMELKNKITFSTVTLSFSEPSRFFQEKIPNNRLDEFRPRFTDRISVAFSEGWQMFLSMIISFTYLWVFILLLAVGVGFYYYTKKREQ
jgi:hypothetical protein